MIARRVLMILIPAESAGPLHVGIIVPNLRDVGPSTGRVAGSAPFSLSSLTPDGSHDYESSESISGFAAADRH